MKRAITLPAYRDVKPFDMPEGVTKVTIDPESMALATPECPVTREEVFIHGTEPAEFCPLHGGTRTAGETPPGQPPRRRYISSRCRKYRMTRKITAIEIRTSGPLREMRET